MSSRAVPLPLMAARAYLPDMRFASHKTLQPPALPAGERIYAVGDIHGRRDLLDKLLKRIHKDLNAWKDKSRIVFLGDYIDRGPDSAAVLDRLVEGPGPADAWICLKGNHDHFAHYMLTTENWQQHHLDTWLANGGDEAMRSWGIPSRIVRGDPDAAVAALKECVPAEHGEFLARLRLSYRAGDYMFVHAGIRPGVPLELQDERDLLWIRSDFLNHRHDFGAHVVHGHTITRTVDARPNRTGIDTGAYSSGRLTALVLEGAERRVLST